MEENKEIIENTVGNAKENTNEKKSRFNYPVFFVILGVVTVLCVVLGLCFNVSRANLPGLMSNLVIVRGEDVTENYDVKDASEIIMNISVANVEIIEGDRFEVTYKGGSAFVPEVVEKDGRLTVSQKENITFFPAIMGGMKNKIVLTIPNNTSIENLTVKESMGNMTMKDVSTDNMTIKSEMGNVTGENITVKDKASFTADCGNIEIKNVNCANMDATYDAGNIGFFNSAIDECLVKSDLGNITLEGEFGRVSGDCSLGNIIIKNSNENCRYDIDTDLGNCKVNGDNYTTGISIAD